jgi:hypothetical protein
MRSTVSALSWPYLVAKVNVPWCVNNIQQVVLASGCGQQAKLQTSVQAQGCSSLGSVHMMDADWALTVIPLSRSTANVSRTCYRCCGWQRTYQRSIAHLLVAFRSGPYILRDLQQFVGERAFTCTYIRRARPFVPNSRPPHRDRCVR